MAVGSGPFAQVTPAALGVAVVGGLASGWAVSSLCRSRDARHPTRADVGLRRHLERPHRIHRRRRSRSRCSWSSARSIARRARSRRWRTCRRISRREVRYRVEIEPTFERHLYDPLARGVIRLAERMKVLQAGSLHAYLGYVLVLGAVLLIWLGGQ